MSAITRSIDILPILWLTRHDRSDSSAWLALSEPEKQTVREAVANAIYDENEFNLVCSFYLDQPIDMDTGDCPAELKARFVSGGVDLLSGPELLQVATSPFWIADLRDAVTGPFNRFRPEPSRLIKKQAKKRQRTQFALGASAICVAVWIAILTYHQTTGDNDGEGAQIQITEANRRSELLKQAEMIQDSSKNTLRR